MKWYLAGRMTGIPQRNIPRFEYVAKKLREAGYNIVTPIELDTPEEYAHMLADVDGSHKNATLTWGEFLARDCKLIADEVDGLIMMDTWFLSKGAIQEAFTGLNTGKKFMLYSDYDGVVYFHPTDSLHIWALLKTALSRRLEDEFNAKAA